MAGSGEWEGSRAKVAFRLLVGASAYPIEYAKVLIQIGYEPYAPRPTRTLFGKPALALSNVFQFVGHIKKTDGFLGCYRGLGIRLCCTFLYGHVYDEVIKKVEFEGEDDPKSEDELSEDEKRTKFFQLTLKDLVGKTVAIIASQPLHVITVRTMAQYVGGQHTYVGFLTSVSDVYKENGLSGFFSGLVPRILGEVISILIANSLTYVVNTYFMEDKELQTYSGASMRFIASAITYPFQVVSNCMAVSGSGLAAGCPPHMPVYVSWVDCWSHLSQTKQLKRGGSLLWRYYTGPQVIVGGQAVAITPGMFKPPSPSH